MVAHSTTKSRNTIERNEGWVFPKIRFYDGPFLIQSTIGSIQIPSGEKKSRCPDSLSITISVLERPLEDWAKAPFIVAFTF
jgi:hypothetical protein